MVSSTISTSFVSVRRFSLIFCHAQGACSHFRWQHHCSSRRPGRFIDHLTIHSLILASQVNLLDLLNTYVTTVFFSVTHNDSMSITLRLQRVMHSLLATRILLHVREAFQEDGGNTALTDLKFAHGTNDTGTGRSTNTGQGTIPTANHDDS
jgi:hypothetical protein